MTQPTLSASARRVARGAAAPLTLLLACALAGASFGASRASACGGCFGPVGQPTEVTAHRMAVMFGPEETTLWDQFEYTGAPEDFVWVLPVNGTQEVRIEESSNDFFVALSGATTIQLQAPLRSTGRGGGGGFGCGATAASGREAGGPMSEVTVFREETVGPYETATIGSEDSGALVAWLQERGYGVPSSIMPTIQHYVDLGMNFVALRLSPGEGIDRMEPVRVVTPGVGTAFPLRMVGAGVTTSVSLELFVLGEGRYEPANFGTLEIDRSALIYDYATESFNYDELAAAAIEESAGGAWLTEVAQTVTTTSLVSVVAQDGQALETRDDVRHINEAIGPTVYVTRMRADLPFDALREDLILMASDRGDLPNFIQVENDVNFGATSSGLSEAGLPPAGVFLLGGVALGFAFRRLRRRAA